MPSIIQKLIDIEAVKVETEQFFTWTSGLKSPIYCDNRLTMSYPEIRNMIAEGLVEKIHAIGTVDVIAGCATAGIPHAAWVADKLQLPLVYVRSSAKKHGKGNQIEGHIQPGQRVVVIEDLISTGTSSIQAANALQAVGAEVVGVLSIFTYGLEKADQSFEKAGFSYESLTGFRELIDHMYEQKLLTNEEQELLNKWRKDPYVFTEV